MTTFQDLFTSRVFMPHGHCYMWEPAIVWLQVVTNLSIGIAYVAISAMLATLVYRIRDLPFKAVYLAFGTFIVSCGITHFIDVVVIWRPIYWWDTMARTITAVASVGTAFLLPALLPRARALMEGARAAHKRGIALETAVVDLESLYQRAREVERLKSEFFAGVSHDLRTPLTLILGPVELLLQGDHLAAADRAALLTVQGNAQLLLGHVANLLDTAKVEGRAPQVAYGHTCLAALARQSAAHFQPAAQAKQVQLEVDAYGPLEADIDIDKTRRILLNLLSNALHSTPSGGHIVCGCGPVGEDKICLWVEDSGPGVPAPLRDKIFRRFVRAERSGSDPGGAGLGLSIVRDFAELQAGKVAVETSRWGGAKFVVHLPRRAPAGAEVADSAPNEAFSEAGAAAPLQRHACGQGAVGATEPPRLAPPEARTSGDAGAVGSAAPTSAASAGLASGPSPGTQPEILVVEDNPTMRDFLAGALADTYRVRTAENGLAALAALRVGLPDLVISDRVMPSMGGDELLRQIRANPAARSLPVLMLTAMDDPTERAALLSQGAQDFLGKPFRLSELRARVANLIALKQVRDVLEGHIADQEVSLAELAVGLKTRSQELQAALAEARDANAEAARLSRGRADFIHLIAHELGTPLTALRLQIGRLARRTPELPERRRPLVAQLDVSSRRISDLVSSLLQFNRLSASPGHLVVVSEPIDLAALYAELEHDFSEQALAAQVSLRGEIVPPELTVRSDRGLLRMGLSHLLANAMKFTPAGGAIALSARRVGQHIHLQVRDDGPGIEARHQEAIFEPFVHLEDLRHKHTPGIGLGLPLVRATVRALEGELTLVSGPGEGTAFTILLAAAPPEQTSPLSPPEKPADRHR